MTDEEMKVFIQSELDKRMIPHPEGIVVEINERPFTPAEAPTDSILGRLVIAGREFMATLRAIRGNRMLKVILWVAVVGIPTFGFYFPAQYGAAKLAASLSFDNVQHRLEANPPPRQEYVMVNYHWRQDENRYGFGSAT